MIIPHSNQSARLVGTSTSNAKYRPLPDALDKVKHEIHWNSNRSEILSAAGMAPIIELRDTDNRVFRIQLNVFNINDSLQPAWRIHSDSSVLVDKIRAQNNMRSNLMRHISPAIQSVIRGLMQRETRWSRFGMYAVDQKRRDLYASWGGAFPDFVGFTGLYNGVLWVRKTDETEVQREIERHEMLEKERPDIQVHNL